MSFFSSIPIRLNGQIIDAAWFNILRTLLISILGDVQGQVSEAIGNTDVNQDITELTDLDGDLYFRVDISYTVRRTSTTKNLVQSGKFYLHWKSTGWEKHGDEQDLIGDDGQIEFSLLQADELITVRQSTTDIGGTGHSGSITTMVKLWLK